MARTRDFADVIRAKLAADPDLAAEFEEESFSADIAMKVYEARVEAGLTQKNLAELVGTQQSVIARIEDADYDGHSLKLLRRIARVLGKRLRVEFYACPAPPTVKISHTFTTDWPSPGVWQVDIQHAQEEPPDSGLCVLPEWPSARDSLQIAHVED